MITKTQAATALPANSCTALVRRKNTTTKQGSYPNESSTIHSLAAMEVAPGAVVDVVALVGVVQTFPCAETT